MVKIIDLERIKKRQGQLMKCNHCGEKIKINKNQKFCPECGAEIKPKKTLSKKAQVLIACACCLVLIISGTIGGLYFYKNNNTADDSDSNYVAFEQGFTDIKITDEKSALEVIASVADVIGIENVEGELKISSTNTIDGDTYYRFQQYYNNIPVYGNSLVISADKDGNATALTSNYQNPSLKKIKDDSDSEKLDNAKDNIENYLKEEVVQLSTFQECYIQLNNKLIFSYEVMATTKDNIYKVFLNAEDGSIIKYESIFNYSSSEVVSENGNVKAIGWQNDDGSYHLYNDEHKISIFDFSQFSESKHTEWNFKDLGIDTMYSESNIFDEKGVKLMAYLCKFDDYFKSLGDEGFDQIHAAINDSIGTNASAGGCSYFENGKSIRIGALFVGEERNMDDIDVISHEYTHMVSKSICCWDGQEAGAINEGISDIFGEILESNLTGQADWKHDGRIISDPENSNNEQRYPASIDYLLNKAKKSNGDRYFTRGNSFWGGQDEDYSHFASTIISHSAYLMNTGIDQNNAKEIDMDVLGELWYKSIYLMHSDATFSQCRNAVELSARIMLKNGELTQEQYNCVCEAFDTVGIENASYTYKSTVKNDFNLKVLSSEETDNVNFNLKIYKSSDTALFSFLNSIKKPVLVLEENSLYGNKQINLDDGAYLLEITDLDDDNTNSKPITTKIIVDGNSENASDEVIIYTDFSDITTVVLNKEAKDDNLTTISGNYTFSSGVGAWSTELNINDDFTFSGIYHDSELGLTGEKNPNGTVIICEFTGKFSSPEKIDEYTYKLSIESFSLKYEDGYVYYNDGIEYECIGEPYGFDGCREFYLYIKGRQTSDLSEEFLGWMYEYDENSGVLPYNCIRNPQTDVCFVKYESTEENNTEDTQDESTTVKESTANNVGKFYGNQTAEQLRKSIIGSWGALGSIVPEYNFIDSENCSGEFPWQSSGTYSISDSKMLTISWVGKSESERYIWSSESWDEFYSHYEYGVYFWYMTDDGVLMLNGKEKYREGVDNYTYNTDGDLMEIITGTWISDKGHKEYQINSDGTWVESTVVASGGTLINRTKLDNGKVEIIDDTTAKLWQEVDSLSQLPGASELIYDSENDKISVGGTNNSYTRATYE